MGLVMFDYDGVIVDSFEQVCSDFLKACSAYGFAIDEEGFNCLHDDNCYRAMKEQYGLSEKVIDAILQEYEEITKKKQDLRVFEGLHEAIKKKMCIRDRILISLSVLGKQLLLWSTL